MAKICPDCDTEVGESETACPKCQCDFETTEATIKELERVERIRAKRKEKETPAPEPKASPKLGMFENLAIKRKK